MGPTSYTPRQKGGITYRPWTPDISVSHQAQHLLLNSDITLKMPVTFGTKPCWVKNALGKPWNSWRWSISGRNCAVVCHLHVCLCIMISWVSGSASISSICSQQHSPGKTALSLFHWFSPHLCVTLSLCLRAAVKINTLKGVENPGNK